MQFRSVYLDISQLVHFDFVPIAKKNPTMKCGLQKNYYGIKIFNHLKVVSKWILVDETNWPKCLINFELQILSEELQNTRDI